MLEALALAAGGDSSCTTHSGVLIFVEAMFLRFESRMLVVSLDVGRGG